MDKFKAIKLFYHTHLLASMSGAGKRFGLSPASVSRQISALEDDLGVRLLNRTSRKMSLTEAGQIYFLRAERLLQDLNEMSDEVKQLGKRPHGTLRVHSRISLGTQRIAPLLPELLFQYPDLKVDLWLSDTDLDLTEHTIDVAIRFGKLTDSSLITRKLATSPRVICATPGYWAHHPTLGSPNDLAAHNCLTYGSNFVNPIWMFLAPNGALVELLPTGNFQTNNAEALRTAALSGLGVALLPAWSIQDELANGSLKRVLNWYEATPTDFDDSIYAVYQSKRNLSVKTRLFIDHLVTVFQKQEWSYTGQDQK